MKPSLNFLSASKLATMLRAGEITSRQTVEAYFAQIKKHNPAYNAIVTLNEAEALAQADQADRSREAGKPCGPLHGVPITIKDTYRVKGSRTTAGYLPLQDYIPDSDAVAVTLLKDAGAIIIGRTNTPTLAMDMQTDNPIFGKTNNPWDVTRTSAAGACRCACDVPRIVGPAEDGIVRLHVHRQRGRIGPANDDGASLFQERDRHRIGIGDVVLER